MSGMRWLLVICAIALPCVARAGVAEGVNAFNAGRHADARRELVTPAEAGDAQAMAYMGEMLMRGLGGTRDELKARDYITRAHAADNVRATFLLGTMHLSGNLVARDEEKGAGLIRQAADKGESAAQFRIGLWLANGTQGYAKDEDSALAWFKLAADQKNAAAMNAMGNYSEFGRAGIVRDYLLALDWYKKSGNLGNVAGMSNAGRLYALGRGVSADGTEALRWLRRAAAVNHYDAFRWIASVYEFGRGGVAKNPLLAYAWYGAIPSNADAAIVKSAAAGKARLVKVLSDSELQEAEKQAKQVAGANTLRIITARIGNRPDSGAPRTGVYGSGVVVSAAGHIVTNEHVINNCGRIRIRPQGVEVRLLAKDTRNDLALLQTDGDALTPARLRSGRGLRLGDDVIAIGYPLKGLLSSGAVVTTGIVNAMTGVKDDTSAFQISATVQPGSSGGPIFDRGGNVVGIVRQRLLSTTRINAQNVNFGINLATLSGFLDAHGVDYQTAQAGAKAADTADIVERARLSTVQVECY